MTYGTWRPIFVHFQTQVEKNPFKAVVRLPTNIKKVAAIKLVGVRQNLGEIVMLDVREAQTNNGELICNDEILNSNFYALPKVHETSQPLWDSSEQGLRCVSFTPRNMPTLTFELRNMNNEPLLGENADTPTETQECSLWLRILTECDD